MFRQLPRAGSVIRGHHLLAGVRSMLGKTPTLERVFAQWLPATDSFVVSSGRAALLLILEAARTRSSRREVVIPAYTCPTVALSVQRAGLTVKLCDVDPATGNIATGLLDQVVNEDTLAIVLAHMFGLPLPMEPVLQIADRHGALVIEDCAQATAATWGGQRTGTFGHFALFSLGRGKGFTTYEGGIIVCHSKEHTALLQERVRGAHYQLLPETITIAKLLLMSALFHPAPYWLLHKLPLGWENEVYAGDFEIGLMGRFRKGVAISLLGELDGAVAQRRDKAEYLRGRLAGIESIRALAVPRASRPSYPWLTILVDDAELHRSVCTRLSSEGLGASRLFTKSLNQYEYLEHIVPRQRCPGAEYIAARLLTLPTHGHVTRDDLDRMVSIISSSAAVRARHKEQYSEGHVPFSKRGQNSDA